MTISKFIDLSQACQDYLDTTGTLDQYLRLINWDHVLKGAFKKDIKVVYVKIVK